MLKRSIPQYEVMRQVVYDLGCRFAMEKKAIVDLGCSRGQAIKPFITKFGSKMSYVGVEQSPAMVKAAREELNVFWRTCQCSILEMDLRKEYPEVPAGLTLAIFTLQFIPIVARQKVLGQVFKWLQPGGAFIVAEKMLGESDLTNRIMVEEYHKLKLANGYTQIQIDEKARSLENILMPLTGSWNEQMLHAAGFAHVQRVWQWYNFAAWLCVK